MGIDGNYFLIDDKTTDLTLEYFVNISDEDYLFKL